MQYDGQVAVGLDADDGDRVEAALVEDIFHRRFVQADDAFKECAGCCTVILPQKNGLQR